MGLEVLSICKVAEIFRNIVTGQPCSYILVRKLTIWFLKYRVSDQTSETSAIGATYRRVFFILEVATHKVWKNHIVSFLTKKYGSKAD